MSIVKFLQDGQDPKVVEKIHDKILDMLTSGEFIQYISLQKKPAVTLLPDSITVSNKRIFLCEFTKLGLATNFEIFSWSDIKDIAFKEEIFGSKVTVIPFTGENLTVDYIPKVQARKLYQLIKEALENVNNPAFKIETETTVTPIPTTPAYQDEPKVEIHAPQDHTVVNKEAEATFEITNLQTPEELPSVTEPKPVIHEEPAIVEDDELTLKLKKLKNLYDRQLITQAEYENKKSDLLSQL
ncbi:hypothetical protein E2P86_02865 [Sphingobacterium psychroaquaticum]|uniref:PH domain-containing protein n=1 Tax=Sphingobacterium psychroaquaticum TaxID=561061 RepID=UPI00106AB58A|nr:PH domain-containing protein [Sphingobacterium psychroaquaticum]QBQ40145.1 hypothetical protein E2P86_02865 [Sphingobacterium psychroaquaticum]